MSRDKKFFINDIIESINLIEMYSTKLTLDKLNKDLKIQDALIRRIEIIGEAIKNLPIYFISRYPDIPWNDIGVEM